MVSQAVGVDTIFSFASDLPAAQEENPTAQTAPIFPATQPASVVSAASPIVQAETATSPTVQAETATSLTAPDVSPSTPESPPPPSTSQKAAEQDRRLDLLDRQVTTLMGSVGEMTSAVRDMAAGMSDVKHLVRGNFPPAPPDAPVAQQPVEQERQPPTPRQMPPPAPVSLVKADCNHSAMESAASHTPKEYPADREGYVMMTQLDWLTRARQLMADAD